MLNISDEEKKFLVSVLTDGTKFSGTFRELVPILNLVESILNKLQASDGAPIAPSEFPSQKE